jgi:hypothetical protein
MHAIHFCVPTLFQADSSPAEKNAVSAALNTCLASLRGPEPRTRLIDAGQNCVAFLLPRAFHANSKLAENAAALNPLLECLCAIDLAYLRFRPTGVPYLYDHPLQYDRTSVWDTTPALYQRNFGDCKSLSATRVAELRNAGIAARPVFRFMPPKLTKQGQFQYHILIMTPFSPTGWEDPSKVKGMGKNENSYFDVSPKAA